MCQHSDTTREIHHGFDPSHPNSPSTNWFTNHQTVDKSMSILFSTAKATGYSNKKGSAREQLSFHSKPTRGWELPEQPRMAAEATSTTQNSQTTKPSTCIITQVGSEWARVPNKCWHPSSPSKLNCDDHHCVTVHIIYLFKQSELHR